MIGGGIVGINAALRLRETHPDANIVVLERGNIPAGASTRNAGFACFGSPTELLEDVETMGWAAMLRLVRQRWSGLNRLRSLLGDQALAYKNYGGYEIFPQDREEEFRRTEAQLDLLNRRLASVLPHSEVFEVTTQNLPSGIRYGIKNHLEGQLHPGRMMAAFHRLAHEKRIRLLYGMDVDTWQESDGGVLLNGGNFSLKTIRLLVATNGFARQLLPDLALRPARNQVLVTEPIPGLTLHGCYHLNRGYVYFRNVGNRVLLGGGRHLAKKEETTTEFGQTDIIRNYLEKLLSELILPNRTYTIAQTWSGIMGVGDTKVPIVRRVSERIGVAVRLGGMGVAIGSEIGNELAELMRKPDHPVR